MSFRKVLGRHAASALVLLAGCGANPAAERSDLHDYMRRVQTWARIEAETGRAIDRILATHFVDEGEVRRQIAESRPRVQAHVLEIRSHLPATPAVRSIHARYVEAWQHLLSSYDRIERGLEQGDQGALASGRTGLLEWRRDLRSVAGALRELVERHGRAEPETKDGLPADTDRPSS